MVQPLAAFAVLAAAMTGLSVGASTGVASAEVCSETPAASHTNSVDYLPRITRATIVERGRSWLDGGVTRCPNRLHSHATYGTYRRDCSGFVSMAWGLKYSHASTSLTDAVLWFTGQDLSYPIALEELLPGDMAFRSSPSNHVLLFVRWDGNVAVFWESATTYQPVDEYRRTVDQLREKGHTAYRRNNLDEAPPLPPAATISSFSASPALLPSGGGAATLSATTANAQSVAFTGSGLVGGTSSNGNVFNQQTMVQRNSSAVSTATHTFTAVAQGPGGSSPARQTAVRVRPRDIGADFNNDGRFDFALLRPTTGEWGYLHAGSPTGEQWAWQGDIPAPGDYNGDGVWAAGVYRPSTGQFIMKDGPSPVALGGPFTSVPVQADYNGDGKTDPAAYEPSSGNWRFSDGSIYQWGWPGDIPVPADYTGDGLADIAIYRPSTGQFVVNNVGAIQTPNAQPGDIPVPADYNGDGQAEVAVYRPSTGYWYRQSGSTQWGWPGDDIPVPGDYDGDGDADIAIYRPSTSEWWVNDPLKMTVQPGLPTDVPAVQPRALPTITGFTGTVAGSSATTVTFPSSGGSIDLSANATNATSVAFNSTPAIPGLPTFGPSFITNAPTRSTTSIPIPANNSYAPVSYTITATAIGYGGIVASTNVVNVTVEPLPPTGQMSGGPGVVSLNPHTLDIFTRDANNQLVHLAWTGSGWSTWYNRSNGITLSSDPDVASWDTGRLDLFSTRADGNLWHRWRTDGTWSQWENLGQPDGGIVGGASVTSSDPMSLDVFARNSANALVHKHYDRTTGWSGWNNMGGELSSDPDAVSWGSGRVDVFARGSDGNLWHRGFEGSWGWWENLGTPGNGTTGGPSAVSKGPNTLEVFIRDGANALFQLGWDPAHGWSIWNNLGGELSSDPDAASWGPGRLDVFARGSDGNLWHRAFEGSWAWWENLGRP